jgi:SAM-dependent methyltransferase
MNSDDVPVQDEKLVRFIDNVRRIGAGKGTSTLLELVFELELFRKIRGESVTPEELAVRLELPLWSARVIAQFLCREGLLLYRDGKLSNAPGVDPLLIVDNKELYDMKNVVFNFKMPLDALRQQMRNPPPENGYQRLGRERHLGSANIRRVMWGEQMARQYSFKGHRALLDVASASGGTTFGILKSNPHLACTLLDLPDLEEPVNQAIVEAGVEGSVRFVGGSFFDPLPTGADVVLLGNIIHNWPPEDDLRILANIFQALEPGGSLIVREAFFEDDWTGTMEALFQSFFMGVDSWQPTYGEVETMLREVGFVDVERKFELVIGRKPPVGPQAPGSK